MAQLDKSAFLAKIASLLPNNTTGQISPEDLRTLFGDASDSFLFEVGGVPILKYTVGNSYPEDAIVLSPDNRFYRATESVTAVDWAEELADEIWELVDQSGDFTLADGSITFAKLAESALDTDLGIGATANTVPTSEAVKDYVDTQIGSVNAAANLFLINNLR